MALHSRQTIGGLVSPYDVAIRDNAVFADDGVVYQTVQGAVDNADSYVYVGPGEFNERVVISQTLTLLGSGRATHINGKGVAGEDAIKAEAPGLTVKNLSVSTDGAGSAAVNFSQDGSGSRRGIAQRIWIREGASNGIHCEDDDISASSIIIEDLATGLSGDAVRTTGGSTDCRFFDIYCMKGATDDGLVLDGGDHVVAACHIDNPVARGIAAIGGGIVIDGNRVIGAGTDGIHVDGENCIVDSNIVTGSAGVNIDTATPVSVTVGDNHTA